MIRTVLSLIKRNPGRKGVIRLRSLSNDKDRLRNGQLVITQDGLGTIKEYMAKKDEQGRLELPAGVNVAVRNLKYKARIYNLKDVKVVDIIDAKTGDKYPAAESDYLMLLLDDAPVTFTVTRKNRAMLTNASRKQLSVVKIFARKQNGIKIFNELTQNNLWSPLKK
jgi:hypothetical protein